MSHPSVDLDCAEAALGFHFAEPLTAAVALSPWHDGFSRLEFLGDAILGLALYAEVARRDLTFDVAAELVSNRHLDAVFHRTLRHCTSADTGDVVEAVLGAAHLARGYEAAADLARRVTGFDDRYGDLPLRTASHRATATVGSVALRAVAADWVCLEHPDAPHRVLSDRRDALIRRARLGALARRTRGASSAPRVHRDAAAVVRLYSRVGGAYWSEGWLGAVRAVVAAGVLPRLGAEPAPPPARS